MSWTACLLCEVHAQNSMASQWMNQCLNQKRHSPLRLIEVALHLWWFPSGFFICQYGSNTHPLKTALLIRIWLFSRGGSMRYALLWQHWLASVGCSSHSAAAPWEAAVDHVLCTALLSHNVWKVRDMLYAFYSRCLQLSVSCVRLNFMMIKDQMNT